MPKVNLHSHTQFCDGRASMQDMVAAAYNAGFKVWGFTPHAPIGIPSPCNMQAEDVDAYKSEVERLRKLYPGMTLLAGMEVDYLHEQEGPHTELVKSYQLDYVIGSVHFIPNQQGVYIDIDGSPERFKKNLEEVFSGDLKYVVRTFWKQTQAMIASGGFDIIGHIDKIGLNASYVDAEIENDMEYRELAEETLRMAIASGMGVEINTKQYERYGRFFPHIRYWTELKEAGVKMPVNSDAHETEKIDSGMSKAFEILEKL